MILVGFLHRDQRIRDVEFMYLKVSSYEAQNYLFVYLVFLCVCVFFILLSTKRSCVREGVCVDGDI